MFEFATRAMSARKTDADQGTISTRAYSESKVEYDRATGVQRV